MRKFITILSTVAILTVSMTVLGAPSPNAGTVGGGAGSVLRPITNTLLSPRTGETNFVTLSYLLMISATTSLLAVSRKKGAK